VDNRYNAESRPVYTLYSAETELQCTARNRTEDGHMRLRMEQVRHKKENST